MEVNKERAQAAQDCFEFNKQLNTVHVTSDLTCFGNKSDAINHARGLGEKTIDVFNRDGDGEVEYDLLETYTGIGAAKTLPDADLAKAKSKGAAKGESFEKVKKPAAVDATPKYGTDAADSAKPKKPAAGKKATDKPAASKKAAAPKAATQAEPAAEQTATEQPAADATQSTDPSTSTENQQ